MNRIALIGYPLLDSVSPKIQNAALGASGLHDWVYDSCPTRRDELRSTLERIRREKFAGAHVSIPHKRTILPLLDGLAATSRMVGAVNTVISKGNELIGDNTEGIAFMNVLAESQVDPRSANVILFGASNAAYSIAIALGQARIRALTVFNRSLLQAARLADKLHSLFPNLLLSVNRVQEIEGADLFINSSSIGMNSGAGESPLPIGTGIPSMGVVVDLVYNPRETNLIRQARLVGARAITGDEVLVQSSALSFKLWTGQDAPIDVMKAALDKATKVHSV